MAEDPLSMSLDDIIKQKAVKGSGAGASRPSNGKSGSRSGGRKRFTEKLQVTVNNNSRKPSRPRARVLTVSKILSKCKTLQQVLPAYSPDQAKPPA